MVQAMDSLRELHRKHQPLVSPLAHDALSARLIGAVSLASWFAVLYFGRMLPYLDPNPRSGV